jgi:osomolarity two-component system sensor histidine kinase TcsA
MQDWKRIVTRREPRDRTTTPIADTPDDELQKELRIVSATKNLLLVEDNLINQKVMLGMLRSMGFKNVGLASNGVEAVRMVRGKPAAYDLVLMDINMPIMDGHAATKDIRAAGILVPVIAMTAYALKGDRELCLEHGMNDYIAKPVDKKQLARVLGKWLLRTTDYRKNFEERLAELRRHQESLGQIRTPGLEAKQFLFDVANESGPNQTFGHIAPATPPAEEPRSTPASGNSHPVLIKDVSNAPEASNGRDMLDNTAAELNGFSLRLPAKTGTSDQAGAFGGKAKEASHGIQPEMKSVVIDTTGQQGHTTGEANWTPDAKSDAAEECRTADKQNPEPAAEATKLSPSVESVETQPRLEERVNISVNKPSLSGLATHGPTGDGGVASVDAKV